MQNNDSANLPLNNPQSTAQTTEPLKPEKLSNEAYNKLYEQQQKDIKSEIEKDPLVSDIIDLQSIFNEFADNKKFLNKIGDLTFNYQKTKVRKLRKDGSCFYRGFIYRLCELLIENKSNFTRFKLFDKINKARAMMLSAGFQDVVFESFEDMFKEFLSSIQSGDINKGNLHQSLNDKENFDYYVMYIRFIVSAYVRTNIATYEMYFESEYHLINFCQTEVEPIDSEADQIQIVALFNYFDVPIRIFYIDNSAGDKVTCLSLPDLDVNKEEFIKKTDNNYPLQLLYKPGHYDIVY